MNKVPSKIFEELSQVVQNFFKVRPTRHKHQWKPLHIAAECGLLSLCKYITKDYKVNFERLEGFTPFYLAAQNGHRRVCRFVISMLKNGEVPLSIRNGVTPLHATAMNGHMIVCQMIIDDITDKNPKDDNAWTLLQSAAKRGHLEVCRIIIVIIKDR